MGIEALLVVFDCRAPGFELLVLGVANCMKGHLYSSALNTFAPVMGIGLKKSLMPFVWLASIALRLEPVAFFWESIDGTPIASNNRANSVWRISVCPVASLCPLAKSPPTRSLKPSMESPYSLSSAMRLAAVQSEETSLNKIDDQRTHDVPHLAGFSMRQRFYMRKRPSPGPD